MDRGCESSKAISYFCSVFAPSPSNAKSHFTPYENNRNYGISAPSTASTRSLCVTETGAPLLTEATPLTNPEIVLSFAGRTWQGVVEEFQRARQCMFLAENDIEKGGETDAFSFFSVTIRRPLTSPKLVALGYSYMPFLLFCFLICSALCAWSVLPLYAAAIGLTVTLLNESFFKKIMYEPRPALSVVKSPGMPSSHCMLSFSFLCWCLLEAVVSPAAVLSRLLLVCSALVIFAPMPWARFYLGDHSEFQCFVGCLGGALWGVFVFVLRHILFPSANFI